MSKKPVPTHRSSYHYFDTIPTRWLDNDAYGHVNNVVYYAYFDSAVTRHLIESGIMDTKTDDYATYVVESRCTYFSAVAFPDTVHVGVKVVRLGTSSVHYELALFQNDAQVSSALCDFIHVYVDKTTTRPIPMPEAVRKALAPLVS